MASDQRSGDASAPNGGRGGGGQGRSGGGKGGQGKGGQGKGGQGKGGQGKGGQGKGGKHQPRGGKGQQDETAAQLAGPLQKVLGRLPETQRKVLELRMGLADGHPHDLADTARELGLSLSEARDIERRAFEHIREAIPLQQLQRFLDR
jgi:hypothetical protein